ncbi:DUF4367 domain-containing protein [Blautia obeum]|uniref:DUF4367 domain-containing protein n=2 Tax=Blautia obeum TaxID=40520 RepID=A0A414J1K0_9FIRM|nr:DUF4367 domain-containing protein [Blautia obeum]RHE37627.1 DUF4367 domain-containing protein [Blautia obeum]
MRKEKSMKNWKKIMAMVCAAAMIGGVSAPVWATDDTETATEAAEVTEYTYDMLEKEAYEGTWLSFEPGFDLYVPSDWEVLEVSEEDQKEHGLMFQAKAPDDSGDNMVVTATDIGKDYDTDKMKAELETEETYTDIEKVIINGIEAVVFNTDVTYGLAFLDDDGIMYNVQMGELSDENAEIAQNLFISLRVTETTDDGAAEETAE